MQRVLVNWRGHWRARLKALITIFMTGNRKRIINTKDIYERLLNHNKTGQEVTGHMSEIPESGEKIEKSKTFVRDYSYLEKRIIEMLKKGASATEVREELLRYVGEE